VDSSLSWSHHLESLVVYFFILKADLRNDGFDGHRRGQSVFSAFLSYKLLNINHFVYLRSWIGGSSLDALSNPRNYFGFKGGGHSRVYSGLGNAEQGSAKSTLPFAIKSVLSTHFGRNSHKGRPGREVRGSRRSEVLATVICRH
jgi:hypothetical protein